jgi:hypothetical protein
MVTSFIHPSRFVETQAIYSWDGANWTSIGSNLERFSGKLALWDGHPVVTRYRVVAAPWGFSEVGDVVILREGTWRVILAGTLGSSVGELVTLGQDLYGTTVRYENNTEYSQLKRWDGSQWFEVGSEVEGSLKHLTSARGHLYMTRSPRAWYHDPSYPSPILVLESGSWRPLPDLIYGWVGDVSEHDGDLYIAGYFDFVGDQIVHGLARFDGNTWKPVVEQTGGGADESVRAMLPYGDGLVLAGGFATLDNRIRSGIAKGDGHTWEALGDGVDGTVFALAEFEGDVIAAGDFEKAGTVSALRVARWNGQDWQPMAEGFDERVTTLAVYHGELYAGGWFQRAGSELCSHIARWDGQAWRAVAGGVDGHVLAMAVYGDRLYAGGQFGQAGGNVAPYLASFDGTDWAPSLSSNPQVSGKPEGLSGAVLALTVWRDQLVVGGLNVFDDDDGVLNAIAFWNGADWSTIDGGAAIPAGQPSIGGWVMSLGTYRSSLVAGGEFALAGFGDFSSIAFWNGSEWNVPEKGVDGQVRTVAQVGSGLFIGGKFNTAGGNPSRNLARWDAPGFTSRTVVDGRRDNQSQRV